MSHFVEKTDAAPAAFVPQGQIDMRTSIRPTVAEIDLDAIARNCDRLQSLVGDSRVWGVVKADAYGHGAVQVARRLERTCDALAVSLVEEGLELRASGIDLPIVVLGAFYGRCHAQVLENRLTPVIYDLEDVERFGAAARQASVRAEVHLKVDTGMSRLGISPHDLARALDQFERAPSLRLAGFCTHFASADLAGADTAEAMVIFRKCVQDVAHRGFTNVVVHAANSAAAIRHPDTRLNAVRPGLALYGATPSALVSAPDLEPALRLTTRAMAIRDVAPGAGVSYGMLWRAHRPSRVATLPVGYADGYPRHVQGAQVLIRGRKVPIIGAVCMDMMMVDVTDVAHAAVGDEITLIGVDGAESVTVDDLARTAGTINYEILCGISKRVPRVYKGSS